MLAARLYGPRNLRLDTVPHPGPPGPGTALLRVKVTGICGSDLHSYLDARIGNTKVKAPLTLGHEFSAVVEAVGPDALDGYFKPLRPGTRVAVDPAQPCGRCESCEHGHPNLCHRLHFCGNFPDGGSLCEYMHMPAHSCFPVPKSVDATQAALLEPLTIALHAVDLARFRVGHSAAILGAGPIGLILLQVAKLAGADPVFISDKFPWRLKAAQKYGGIPISCQTDNPVRRIDKETHGRGVDVALEAAWADRSIGEAADMARLGGRLVLVGIPSDNRLFLNHATARRKGLTIMLCRRTKLTFPRAIRLAETGRIDLLGLVTHRFPLKRAPEAFRLNAAYRDKILKAIIKT